MDHIIGRITAWAKLVPYRDHHSMALKDRGHSFDRFTVSR
jgi:hypothetical protein